jgi:WD40-like Beta Propeller Repeat
MTVSTLPTLNFLTGSDDSIDYRPAINSAGVAVVFERTPIKGGLTVLNEVGVVDGAAAPAVLLSGASSVPPSQTRPDWCWTTDIIAFNGAETNTGVVSVWQVPGYGGDPQPIAGTTGCFYPRWSLDGSLFVTEDHSTSAKPQPCNSIFYANGNQKCPNIDGTDAGQTPLFGGMPAVGPRDLPQIAFAGQPKLAGWGDAKSVVAKYDENKNYIFLNTSSGNGVYTSAPMESGASLTTYDPKYQGRAPSWSPDGCTIVFESNREGNGYAIYLYDLKGNTVRQVTDPKFGGQHAKFFPDGTKLILSIHHPDKPKTRGIAWVSI